MYFIFYSHNYFFHLIRNILTTIGVTGNQHLGNRTVTDQLKCLPFVGFISSNVFYTQPIQILKDMNTRMLTSVLFVRQRKTEGGRSGVGAKNGRRMKHLNLDNRKIITNYIHTTQQWLQCGGCKMIY